MKSSSPSLRSRLKYLLCLTPLVAFAQEKNDPPERPNILFLFSDDHACEAISAYPGGRFDEVAPTPGIDRLAKEGLLFENSFCTNSICGPSRASILTGKHSHMNGFLDNGTQFDGLQETFPPLLQKAGYSTALIGKWHLGTEPVGFDYWEVLPGQGSYYNPDLKQMDGSKKRYDGHCNDIVTQLALAEIKRQQEQDKPFMLMAQFKAPHRNWSPALRHLTLFDDSDLPEPDTLFDDYENRHPSLRKQTMSIAKDMSWGHDMKFKGENEFPDLFTSLHNGEYDRMSPKQKTAWDAVYEPKNQILLEKLRTKDVSDKELTRWKYQRYIKDYLRSIRSMDEGISQILDYLDDNNLAENTIVIYSSDQGFYLGEHGWYDKRWMFNESFRMPFLVRWPGVIPAGTTSTALIQNIDYAPTFLSAAGVTPPKAIQGSSLLPLFKDPERKPEGWRDSLYYRYYGEIVHQVAAHDGIQTDRYKLMQFTDDGAYNLFDLQKDPQEMTSLHEDPAYKSTLTRLKEQLVKARVKYHAHSAIIPTALPHEGWQNRHKAMNKLAKEKKHDLLFIGDSITQGWEGKGKPIWEKFYGSRNALNLGISGDRTEHVLYRLNRGNLRNQGNAKVAVVMIGTNNTGHHEQAPSETAEGIERIVSTIRANCPKTQILLLGVFPRGEKPDNPKRILNLKINKTIAHLAEQPRVHYLDLSSIFLDQNGKLSKEIMPDFLHLTPRGYQIWAEAIEPKLVELGL